MSNINDILGFRFSHSSFSERGRNIVPTYIINLGQSRISTLNLITEKIGSGLPEKPTKGIREVYLKFFQIYNSNESFSGKFDKRELRTLTYALTYKEYQESSIFENQYYLKRCFNILSENWRDSFISGLLDCYLSNWGSNNRYSFALLASFLTDKINNYQGSRSLFQTIKANSKFFEKEKGDIDLGATLAILKKPVSEATKHLSLPDQWITYPYFSGVINGYFEKSKNRIEDTLENISLTLEAHSNSTKATKTNKLIVSKIICHISNSNDSIQNKVKDIAFKLVGDPGISSIWRPNEGVSQSDASTINSAREILNEWVTRQFINVFFEKCINDNRRKRFWLHYTKKITSFKVFGPNHIKRKLKSDSRITEYVDGRFHVVDSNRDISAFMFMIGNHKMIEFSDPGYAFYAYNSNNRNAPSFDAKYVSSVDSFRDGNMSMLVYRSGYHLHSFSDEGRLSHHDGDMKWEDVFSNWLKRKAGINV